MDIKPICTSFICKWTIGLIITPLPQMPFPIIIVWRIIDSAQSIFLLIYTIFVIRWIYADIRVANNVPYISITGAVITNTAIYIVLKYITGI